jgi:hypothetical protein
MLSFVLPSLALVRVSLVWLTWTIVVNGGVSVVRIGLLGFFTSFAYWFLRSADNVFNALNIVNFFYN